MSFEHFDQLSYVTNDVDRAIAVMNSRHGAAGFRITPVRFPARVGQKIGTMDLTIATVVIDRLRIEIIQPNEEIDFFYSSVLTGRAGFAMMFHHTGLLLDGTLEDWRAYFDAADGKGQVHFTGDLGEDMKFFYADERDTLGHYVEHFWLSERMRQSLQAG
jgi:hypothetical protein